MQGNKADAELRVASRCLHFQEHERHADEDKCTLDSRIVQEAQSELFLHPASAAFGTIKHRSAEAENLDAETLLCQLHKGFTERAIMSS